MLPRKRSLAELNRLPIDAYRQIDKFSYCLILDDVRSLNNVGSVFRTADAFRAERIFLCGITGCPPHRDITKTALGATESVTWTYHPDILILLRELRQQGWIIVAVEQAEGSVLLSDFSPESDQRYAFVLGNEVHGVQEQVVREADLTLEIPQFGTKHSLNIAVTAGVVCWDYLTKTG